MSRRMTCWDLVVAVVMSALIGGALGAGLHQPDPCGCGCGCPACECPEVPK